MKQVPAVCILFFGCLFFLAGAALAEGKNPGTPSPAQESIQKPAGNQGPMMPIATPQKSPGKAMGQPGPKTGGLHPGRPPVRVGGVMDFLKNIAFLLLGILLVTGLVMAVLYLFFRKRKKQKTGPPPLPPEEIASRRLDAYRDLEKVDPKTFYFGVSAILRDYMEARFSRPFLEMTTEEMIPCVKNLNIPAELRSGVADFCRFADPVKFAGALSGVKDMERDLQFVRRFISGTAPENPVEEEQG